MKPIEVCDSILKLIDEEPDKFNMNEWMVENIPDGEGGCRTIGCVAGWVGALFGDGYGDLEALSREEEDWQARQASRLGMDFDAAKLLFLTDVDRVAQLMLQSCRDHLAKGWSKISLETMERFEDDAEHIWADEEEVVSSL